MNMLLYLKNRLKSIDWILFILVFLLILLGLVIQYSLSLGLEPDSFTILTKQLFFVFIGLVIFFVFSLIDFRILRPLAPFLYGVIFLMMSLLFIFGQKLHGVRGWYSLGGSYFQPVEAAKIILIIILAKIWAGKTKELAETKRFVLSVIFLLPLVGLAFFQPDFGAALIFVLIWFFMTALNVKRIKYFVIITVFFVITASLVWGFALKDYQRARIVGFFSPDQDPLGRGYQIAQAKIAVGAGQFLGRGIGYGSQGQMRFLPASRNDFIFAVLSEEMGFVGSSVLIILFTLIFVRLIKKAQTIYDSFGSFLVAGFGFNLFIHVIVNVGMNIGLLPIVGISLPLISYGGSSMLMTLISLGLVESVIVHQRVSA
jgi:rod shape determining protein RodA